MPFFTQLSIFRCVLLKGTPQNGGFPFWFPFKGGTLQEETHAGALRPEAAVPLGLHAAAVCLSAEHRVALAGAQAGPGTQKRERLSLGFPFSERT